MIGKKWKVNTVYNLLKILRSVAEKKKKKKKKKKHALHIVNQTVGKQCRPRERGVSSGSALFAYRNFY